MDLVVQGQHVCFGYLHPGTFAIWVAEHCLQLCSKGVTMR